MGARWQPVGLVELVGAEAAGGVAVARAAADLGAVSAVAGAAEAGGGRIIPRPWRPTASCTTSPGGGEIHVLKLGDSFEKLATNRLASEPEDFSGTPAISDGQIFIRSSRHLYCVSLPETRGA